MASKTKRKSSNEPSKSDGETKPAKNTSASHLSILIICVLLTVFAITGRLAWNEKSATYDEPLHLVGAWAQTHLSDFRVNPEDPALWKYFVALGTDARKMPLDHGSSDWSNLLDDMKYQPTFWAKSLYGTAGTQADQLIQSARLRMVFIGVALGGLIAWWAWRLGGPIAAIVATAAYTFDPNFLAHAPLVKNDVPMTLIFLSLMALLWLMGERVTIWRFCGLGLMLGAALTTKFSGLLAIPMLGTGLLARAMLRDSWHIFSRGIVARRERIAAAFGIFLAAIVIAWGVIWACYGFRFAPGSNPNELFNFPNFVHRAVEGEYATQSIQSNSAATDPIAENGVAPSLTTQLLTLCNVLHILPQSWIVGFMYTWATTRLRPTFLLGKIGVLGHWYYFPIAALVKTALATLIALGTAGIWLLCRIWKRRKNGQLSLPLWPISAAGIMPAIYLALSLGSNINIGIRHLLPIYPIAYISLGVAVGWAYSQKPKLAVILVCILCTGLASETFAAFPNYIPFFNVAVGGSRGGEHILSDSNIDWGQELIDLARWQRDNPKPQLFLYYFGPADPKYYGINYVSLPGNRNPGEQPDPSREAVYAISAVGLQGTYFLKDESAAYEEFRHKEPFAILGSCIYLFHGTPPATTRNAR